MFKCKSNLAEGQGGEGWKLQKGYVFDMENKLDGGGGIGMLMAGCE